MKGDRGNKERKNYLQRQRIINCGYCKYNRGDNAKRRGRTDRHKNIDRETIRKAKEIEDTMAHDIVEDDTVFGPYSLQEALNILNYLWGRGLR